MKKGMGIWGLIVVLMTSWSVFSGVMLAAKILRGGEATRDEQKQNCKALGFVYNFGSSRKRPWQRHGRRGEQGSEPNR